MKKMLIFVLLFPFLLAACSDNQGGEEVAVKEAFTENALSVSTSLVEEKGDKEVYVVLVCDQEEVGALLLPPQFIAVEKVGGKWQAGSLSDWPEVDRKASVGMLPQNIQSELQSDMNPECIQSAIW